MRTEAHWKKIGLRPHHGICLPLSALRTKRSSGIGEFLDLIPLIDWCKKLGFDCLELLPLNDTGDDPSPYNPISSCALDPVYLSLLDLGRLELPRYEIKRRKLEWLRSYFAKQFPSVSKERSYRDFLSKNASWLDEYARYMALKEDPVEFHCFLQYLSFSQFEKVRSFCRANSFFLIGDMPHFIGKESVDVWAHPHLFHRDKGAGAPPDRYNPLGQNWGFPLFNWEAMREEEYAWWKRRLSTMAHLYDLYRIDHVVGFFRVWGSALGEKISEGSFFPSERSEWVDHGRNILEMFIDACPLLPIGEDLGTIPPEVYPVLKELGIPGTKILRWQDAVPFDQYEPLSLTTVSTPDMEPQPLWWQKFPEEAKSFARFKNWEYEPLLSAKRQVELLRNAHHTSSYFHVNLLQEYLFPFPDLVWPNLEEERINVPGTLLPTNWTYRFRPSLEEIMKHSGLSETILKILK